MKKKKNVDVGNMNKNDISKIVDDSQLINYDVNKENIIKMINNIIDNMENNDSDSEPQININYSYVSLKYITFFENNKDIIDDDIANNIFNKYIQQLKNSGIKIPEDYYINIVNGFIVNFNKEPLLKIKLIADFNPYSKTFEGSVFGKYEHRYIKNFLLFKREIIKTINYQSNNALNIDNAYKLTYGNYEFIFTYFEILMLINKYETKIKELQNKKYNAEIQQRFNKYLK